MKNLLEEIRACTVCLPHLKDGVRPIVSVSPKSKILIIGQAPGSIVHKTGIPWNDKSGDNLRKWMSISEADFYDPHKIGIVPMGFCYPGKGKSGDLPPRKECAPLWHTSLFDQMEEVQLTLLIGSYAQAYYLGDNCKKTLTETVKNYQAYMPEYMVLPHPSPRNNIWMKRNAWFGEEVLPHLKKLVNEVLEDR